MENYFEVQMSVEELNQMSPSAIAHCGDAVFELLVRSSLCLHGGVKNGKLHRDTVLQVKATAQAKRAERLLPLLSEQELAWFKHGRNCHTHGAPKSANAVEYAKATGVECLFGALFLTGQRERANELFLKSAEEEDGV